METTRTALPEAVARESEGVSQNEKKARRLRHNPAFSKPGTSVRFFLAAGDTSDSPPVLGEEFADEDKIIVASFQKNIPFYRVETWRTQAEKKGRSMVLRKQS
jgi:hypothetical protein